MGDRARSGARPASRQIPRLLTDIRSEFPELAEPLAAAQPNLALTEPWQPLFRVGSLGIGYDRLHDLVVFTLVDADALEAMADPQISEEQTILEQLVYTTRGQALLLAQQTERVVAAGRPYCPHCDEPDLRFLATSAHRRTRARGGNNEYVPLIRHANPSRVPSLRRPMAGEQRQRSRPLARVARRRRAHPGWADPVELQLHLPG